MRLFFILLITTQIAVAQQKIVTACNTIFVCIDSTSYQQLFSNPYILKNSPIIPFISSVNKNNNHTNI